MRCILILMLLISLFVIPVSADYNSSGIVQYSYSDSLSYDFSGGIAAIDASVRTDFHHLFTDAQVLNTVIFKDMWSSTLSYSKNDVSPFTATVNGQYYGSGVASIVEQIDHSIFYTIDFNTVDEDYAKTLSGIYVVSLAFDNVITTGLVGNECRYSNVYPYGIDTSHPTQLRHSTTYGLIYVTGSSYNYVQTSYWMDFSNSYDYNLNSTYNISSLVINRSTCSSLWSVYDSEDTLYFEDESGYSSVEIDQDFLRYAGVYANTTYNTGSGPISIYTTIDVNGTSESPDPGITPNISITNDTYYYGDTVDVLYTAIDADTIDVVHRDTGVYLSLMEVIPAENATRSFFIYNGSNLGVYNVTLRDHAPGTHTGPYTIKATDSFTLSGYEASESMIDIDLSLCYLYDSFTISYRTNDSATLSIEDPLGEVVHSETVNTSDIDYLIYTPTGAAGWYTAYLYDDVTLSDTILVYSADPPVDEDPEDGEIIDEDVLEDDETMTEYYNEKFRDFAPTIWGFFMLMCLLFLMSILTSFNSGGKR